METSSFRNGLINESVRHRWCLGVCVFLVFLNDKLKDFTRENKEIVLRKSKPLKSIVPGGKWNARQFVSFDMTAVFTSPFLRNRVMKGRRKGEVDKKNPFEGFCEIGVDSRTKVCFFFLLFCFQSFATLFTILFFLLFYSQYFILFFFFF